MAEAKRAAQEAMEMEKSPLKHEAGVQAGSAVKEQPSPAAPAAVAGAVSGSGMKRSPLADARAAKDASASKTERLPDDNASSHSSIKRPTGAAFDAEKVTVETEERSGYVPPVAHFTPVAEVRKNDSPFKNPNEAEKLAPNGLKAPIKRPASLSSNRAVAMKAQAEEEARKLEEAKKAAESANEHKAPSFTAALADKGEGVRPGSKKFTPNAPIPAAARKNEIDPFKHTNGNAGQDSASAKKADENPAYPSSANRPFNTAAAMKELRAMEAAEETSGTSSSSDQDKPDQSEGHGGGLKGFLGKFKK